MKTYCPHFAVLFTVLLLGLAGQLSASGVQLPGALANVDARYPNSLPNDFEFVLYGDGLTAASAVETWNTNNLLGGLGVQWGTAVSIVASVNSDTTSPAFGLDTVTIRWAGPPRPAMVGQMVNFGARVKIGAAVAHSELWWTINGTRIQRPENAQIIWHATKNGWLIELNNPNTVPIYVYGTRFFAPPTTSPLPTLTQLTSAINPVAFGAAGWTNLALPGGAQVFAIQAHDHFFLKVASASLRPVVFQFATRNVSNAEFTFQPAADGGPNPNDYFGGTNSGTMTIQTTRPTQEFPEDLTGDGVVGIPDFNQLRSGFGKTSADQ